MNTTVTTLLKMVSYQEIGAEEYEKYMKLQEQETGFEDLSNKPKVRVWPPKDSYVPYPTVNIITRMAWGAELPTGIKEEWLPYDTIMLENNTDSEYCFDKRACSKVVRKMQAAHMKKMGESDIQYNFLLGEDGNVYEGRGWMNQSARTLKALTDFPHRLDIGYIGKHESDKPNLELYCLLKTLLRYGIKMGYISKDFSLVEVKDDLRYNKYLVDLDNVV